MGGRWDRMVIAGRWWSVEHPALGDGPARSERGERDREKEKTMISKGLFIEEAGWGTRLPEFVLVEEGSVSVPAERRRSSICGGEGSSFGMAAAWERLGSGRWSIGGTGEEADRGEGAGRWELPVLGGEDNGHRRPLRRTHTREGALVDAVAGDGNDRLSTSIRQLSSALGRLDHQGRSQTWKNFRHRIEIGGHQRLLVREEVGIGWSSGWVSVLRRVERGKGKEREIEKKHGSCRSFLLYKINEKKKREKGENASQVLLRWCHDSSPSESCGRDVPSQILLRHLGIGETSKT